MDRVTILQVRTRAEERCEYCKLPQKSTPFVTFHIDHIYASQHILDDRPENLCLACPHCNFHKGPNLTTIDPDTNEIVPLFHPREQSWDEHFQLNTNSGEITGNSLTGKATVRLLNMNSPAQTEIRLRVIQLGLWE
ncbi:HNH endonuclease [Calycomorphotria hydatis]|uniref:HNH endonuclease n=1 Tax=Calycomorphotria hydatis TaxID=2528027 RepID=A0A517T380_9PLAN|nr:HNH endonuclease [Calycomorphotria hydatis]